MPRFLIKVSQESDVSTVKRITHSIRTLGSHFATHADWRRKERGCTGSMIVEAESERGALAVVPPGMRSHAEIFQLTSAAAM